MEFKVDVYLQQINQQKVLRFKIRGFISSIFY